MADEVIRVYLAGPMTGYPAFNFPAFDAAAANLRENGYGVVSPAELDDPEIRAAALASPDGDVDKFRDTTGETRDGLIRRDIGFVADDECGGIVTLPGWERSEGASLEVFVALSLGKWARRYPALNEIEPEGLVLVVGGTIERRREHSVPV